ncbi:MAG: prephenate dehydrogenase (NADP(+)) [Chrysothrix sp. TS-e1954]|nr:MAG: prephenate dehydrogenase (NADP(+)) [Chrysothrix sp. TS-e1954]
MSASKSQRSEQRIATKVGAIVGGQTSCKAPEIAAFENYMHDVPDVDIVSYHSLHGPAVDPKGQPLVLIPHRDNHGSLAKIKNILSCLGSKFVLLSAEQHDKITADTQAVTHAAFLSMGTAWEANKQFPWDVGRYIGGIENIKINVTLRIFSNKWHVYAGLAIMNPSAKQQIEQYAQSVTELYKLMGPDHRQELTDRIMAARKAVFKQPIRKDLLLKDEVLDKFSLGSPPPERLRNDHLSLLAMVDCWWKLGVVPYDHMICSTPLFRIWLGAAQYLFTNETMLNEAIDSAVEDSVAFRSDDFEFAHAARTWSNLVALGSMEGYKEKFERIQKYFEPRFPEATKVGNEMITTILKRTEAD